MKTALVTGGGGFVARELIPVLKARGWTVKAVVRRSGGQAPEGVETVVGDILRIDWDSQLRGVAAIVHLAGRAHRMGESGSAAEALYQRDNVEATAALARAAARAGVSRFVFLSSVKAMGESTPVDAAWDERSPCLPRDAYGRTKLAAERELLGRFADSGLPVVILRPPLLYGRQVKGNMRRLLQWIDRGVPLPLASVRNLRSFLYAGNLADAVFRCLDHPTVVGKTFLLSDGEDLSTPDLIRRLARARGRGARLFPVPPKSLLWAARLIGRLSEAERLLGSLRVDGSCLRRTLGWTPPFSVDAGLREVAQAPLLYNKPPLSKLNP